MWVHLIIFAAAFGTVLVWKAGWLRLDGIADKESVRLFLLVAICGNILGMVLTLTSGSSEVYEKGHRIEKSVDGAYTEELQVSVDGGEPQKFDVQIPEKETEESEETEAETETFQTPEEARQKKLKEVIEQYNQEKEDPDYYYLPDSWNGQVLQWQKPGETTGTFLAALALFAAVVLMLKKAREQQEELAKRDIVYNPEEVRTVDIHTQSQSDFYGNTLEAGKVIPGPFAEIRRGYVYEIDCRRKER